MSTASISTAPPSDIIEVGDFDDTSDFETSSVGTSTHSLTESVTNYVYENGRRYHSYAEGKYVSPNDEIEQDRLDMTHHVQNIHHGGNLYTAPLKNPQNVLDCGTGTGIWALDFGDQHRQAQVIGVDLSPIQPRWTAPNVKFEVDDLERDWTFKENFFDFIHSRHIVMGIRDWSKYLAQMYRHLQPGGWVEISEQEQAIHCDDGTLEGSTLGGFWELYLDLAPKAGFKFPTLESLTKLLEDAGFVDISVKACKQPWGPWPKDRKMKELGLMIAAISETGMESYSLALLTRSGGMTNEEVRQLCKDSFKDIMGRKVHAYNHQWNIIARKPEHV